MPRPSLKFLPHSWRSTTAALNQDLSDPVEEPFHSKAGLRNSGLKQKAHLQVKLFHE